MTDQLSLLSPPPPYRRENPASKDGAKAIAPSTASLQARVLRALQTARRDGGGGLTDQELAEILGVSRTTIIPRRHELAAMGLVCPDPIGRREAPSGVRVSVWGATEAGVETSP